MNNQPLVSIITPCYNGESFLHRYFNSILAQTYSNIELIFVNDGSSDKTEEIAFSYKDKLEARGIKFIYMYQTNAGQAAAINSALKVFSGEYLTWPDSDDWMSDDCIEKKIDYLELHPEYSLVMCRTAKVFESDLSKSVSYYERKNKNKHNIFDDLISYEDVYFAPGGYMIRSKALLETLPTRSIYCGKTGQNMQLLLPVAYRRECGFVDEVLYYYLIRDNSHSRSSKTPEQIYNSLYGNENTIIQTLERIDMAADEREAYINLAKFSWSQKRFYAAIEFKDKASIAKFYREIESNGKINLKLRIQNFVFRNKLLSAIYNIFKS
ncbi:MAG: glycosyltransferase family 2 protein [Clostridia bacterium]|nr:glycosyltransferase family 2 protein [Clostridia bacterium]